MKHIRPLPPIDDEDRSHFHPSETVVFAPDQNGLHTFRDWVKVEYQLPLEDAPIDPVLCVGDPSPDGEYSTVYPLERSVDLLENQAQASSPAPDPGLSDLRTEISTWRTKLKEEEIGPDESEEEARWRIKRAKERARYILQQLAKQQDEVQEEWPHSYPAVHPNLN